MFRAWLAGIATIVAFTAIASAQGGGKPATGNPTPGTEQPAPPNVADRLTFVGCLQAVDRAATAAADSNTPSNARFELTKAERSEIEKLIALKASTVSSRHSSVQRSRSRER